MGQQLGGNSRSGRHLNRAEVPLPTGRREDRGPLIDTTATSGMTGWILRWKRWVRCAALGILECTHRFSGLGVVDVE